MIEKLSRLRLQVDSEGVPKTTAELKGLTKEGKRTEQQLNRTAKSSVNLGAKMLALVGGVGGVTIAIKRTVTEWLKFDKAMTEVATIAGVSTARMKELRKEALNIAKTIGVDATEAAQGFYQALSAGVEETNVGEFVTTAAKFAKGGLTDVASATDLLTTALNSYSMSATEAQNVGDKLFTTIKLGKTNAEQLARSFARAGSAAAQGGVELNELLGVTAQITKTGVPTAEAFTQIKAAIAALYNPSAELKNIYEELGVTGARQLINQRGLAGALDAVREATGGNEAVFIKALRSIEAYSGALVVTGDNLEIVRDLTGEIAEGTGALDEAAAKTGELLETQIEKLKATFIDVNESIEDQTGIIAGAAVVLDSLASSIKSQEGAIGTIVGSYIQWKTETTNLALEQEALKMALPLSYFERRGRQLKQQAEALSNVKIQAEKLGNVLRDLSRTDISTPQAQIDALNKQKKAIEAIIKQYPKEQQALAKKEAKLIVLYDLLQRSELSQKEWAEEVENTKKEYEQSIRALSLIETAQQAALDVAKRVADLEEEKARLQKQYAKNVLDSEDKILQKLEDKRDEAERMLELGIGEVDVLEEQLRILGLQIEARKKYNKEAEKTPQQKDFESVAKSLEYDAETALRELKERNEKIRGFDSDEVTPEQREELLRRSQERYQEDLEGFGSPPPKAIDLQTEIDEQAKGLALDYSADDPYEIEINRVREAEREKLDIIREATFEQESERQAIIDRIQKETQQKITAIEQAQFQERLTHASNFFQDLATVSKAFGEKGAKAAKAFAIVSATIETYKGAVAAYSSTAAIPVVGPFLAPVAAAAAIAAGLAQVAAIKAQQYQMGGIVGGNSYGGDQLPALVNSGEMILNQQQQRNLFAMANNPLAGSNNGGNVTIVNNAPVQLEGEVERTEGGDLRIVIAEAVEQTKNELTNEAQEGGGTFFPAFEQSYGLARRP